MALPENASFLDDLIQTSNARYKALTFQPCDDTWREAAIPLIPSLYKASYRYRASYNTASVTFELNGLDADANTRLFEQLQQHKEAVERFLGVALIWRDAEDDLKRRRMIRWDFNGWGYANVPAQAEHQQRLVDAMMRFDAALRPYLMAAVEAVSDH